MAATLADVDHWDNEWLNDVEVRKVEPTSVEAMKYKREAEAITRGNEARKRVDRLGALTPLGCPLTCTEHSAHVYVICYGEPVSIRDAGDAGTTEPRGRYSPPITHYVGHTGRAKPPVERIREHASLSAKRVAEIRPGTTDDEERLKDVGRCVNCGGSLDYRAEARRWLEEHGLLDEQMRKPRRQR